MKTITVQEASRDLGAWLRRASTGEQIVIAEGPCLVLLQPVPDLPENLSPREALAQLQKTSSVTASAAEAYLRDVQAERHAIR